MGRKLLKTHKVDFQNEGMEFFWYTVVTSFNWERKAAENIEARFKSMGCGDKFGEIMVPIVEFNDVNAKGKAVKKNRNILESGYIFIKMILNNDTWNIVRQTTGVAGWLNMDGRPSPVSEENVLKIKQQLGALNGEEVKAVEFKGVPGDIIKITNHVMKGLEAEIKSVMPERGLIKASLLSNGFNLELKFEQAELVV